MTNIKLETNELVKTVSDWKRIEEDDSVTISISSETWQVKDKLWQALTSAEQEEFYTSKAEEHGPYLEYTGEQYKVIDLTTTQLMKILADTNEYIGKVGNFSKLTKNAIKKFWEALPSDEQEHFDSLYPNQHKNFLIVIGKIPKKYKKR